MRVADYIIDFLYKKGVRYIFTLAGGGAMFLNDAVAQNKKVTYICHHHEQAAAMASEAYTKLTGNMSAVMLTSGPGSTNAITGLLEAWQNSIPCFYISSQAKKSQMTYFPSSSFIRQLGIQEVNIIPVVQSLTKYASVIERPEDTRNQLEKAYFKAISGRPGPVWLDVPMDVASTLMQPQMKETVKNIHLNYAQPTTDNEKIKKVIQLLLDSKKPLIIAGGGIKGVNEKKMFNKLIHALKIPVVVTDMALDLLEYKNQFYVGHGGTKGQRAANMAIQNADLILVLGSRLAIPFTGHEFDTFAPHAKKIVVDIDEQEHQKKTIHIDLFIHSEVSFFIEVLLQNINKTTYRPSKKWLETCVKLKNKYFDLLPTVQDNKKRVNMYRAVSSISRFSKVGDIFTFDAGITAYICTQAIKFKKKQRAVVPGATLTMGYNLPAVIGIWCSSPKSNIICITGDGSFQMNIHELQTIVHHKIPVKIFVLNNEGYLAIRTTQKNFFQSRFIGEGTDSGVSFPNLKKIAKGYGIKYFAVKKNSRVNSVVSKTLNYKGAVICEILCPKWQDILTVSSKKQPDGKMTSLPIDDMFPFLPSKEMNGIKEQMSQI